VACLDRANITVAPKAKPTKNHFVVKIQRLTENFYYVAIGNKERSIWGRLPCATNPDLNPILKCKIGQEGIFHCTAYFQAIWDSRKGLRVNPFVVLPPETW
jgi:hypothetical protein